MLSPDFAVVGACLGLAATLVYAVAAWNGRVAPNLVTWVLWALIPLIIFSASVSDGGGAQSLLALAAGLGPAFVVLSVVVRRQPSTWRVERRDVGCGLLSLLAIALWAVTRDGTYAIGLSLAADLAAATPTLIKAYRDPESESSLVYLLFVAAAVMVLLATRRWSVATVGFALYAAALYALLCLLIAIGRRRVRPAAASGAG